MEPAVSGAHMSMAGGAALIQEQRLAGEPGGAEGIQCTAWDESDPALMVYNYKNLHPSIAGDWLHCLQLPKFHPENQENLYSSLVSIFPSFIRGLSLATSPRV